ncbi:hypothetical protein QUW15_04460, partial [Desulfovibrio piger]|nr:hypothetical protein [Desulfovibrio piger]
VSGTLAVEAAVNGETVSASLTVGAAKYSLEASPGALTQHKEQKVVFTLKANSQPLPNAKVTFTPSDNFSGLPAGEQTTDKKGQIVVTALTATVSGTLAVEAAVDGEIVSASLTVGAAKYSLEASPNTLTLGMDTKVTFTLTRNENVLANTSVELVGNNVTITQSDKTTEGDGTFSAMLKATGDSLDKRTITATVGGTDTVEAKLSVGEATLVLTDSGGDPQFTKNKQTKTLKAKLTDAAGTEIPLGGTTVKWTVVSSTVSSEAWMRSAGAYNGLTWGTTAQSATPNEGEKTEKPDGTAPTGAEAYLTDIVGEREVTVKASVEYNGQTYEAAETVTFGNGPLSVFKKPLNSMSWTSAKAQCGALPSTAELQAVSGGSGYGAAFAAKWPDDRDGYGWFNYWTGELFLSGLAKIVKLDNGGLNGNFQDYGVPVAVCRR